MAAVRLTPVYDELLDYLVKKASPKEILAYQPSEKAQARAVELLEMSSERDLTPDERAELAQMRGVDSLVSLLKARALEAMQRA